MRFSAIHKLSSYLMAGTAFIALILSDELGPLAVLLGVLGFAASWFWEPPRIKLERWGPWWTALSIAVFGYTGLAILAGEGALVGGARFLVFMLVVKLCNRRSSKDYQQVYVLSFIMLVAGTTLNLNLSYALCFLGYVIFATWALILFHLRREMEENFLLKHSDDSSSEKVEVERILNSRRIVGPAFLAGTSAVSLVIFLASGLLFLMFPRIGFGLFFQKSRGGISMAGFSDGVTLGGHGLIQNDTTVVMRVKVDDPLYRGVAAPELHWRGVAFDSYRNGQWARSARARMTRFSLEGDDEGKRTIIWLTGDRHGASATARERAARGLRQEIYLEPLDTFTVFGASQPLRLEFENRMRGQTVVKDFVGRNDEVAVPHTAGMRYLVWSDVSTPDEAVLRGVSDVDPGDPAFTGFLELPDEIKKLPDDRVRALAREITKNATSPYEKVVAVDRYLKANYSYTLEMDSDPQREPLDYFLFDRKQGHCEYFSSAMAILLRAVGVPTRNVNGFLGGEWNEYGGYIAVRGGDAHSWVEVWFDGVGWVTWDPTPSSGARPLGRGGGGVLGKLRRMLDTMRLQWFKWVVEYDLSRQVNLMKKISGWLGMGGKGGTSATMKSFKKWFSRNRSPIAGGIAVLAAIVIVVAWRRRRRGPKLPGATARRRVLHPIITLHARATAQLARRGHARALAQTPREHAAALRRNAVPGAAPFAELTELYYVARFAQADDLVAGLDPKRAQALLDEIKAALKAPVPKVARSQDQPRRAA